MGGSAHFIWHNCAIFIDAEADRRFAAASRIVFILQLQTHGVLVAPVKHDDPKQVAARNLVDAL